MARIDLKLIQIYKYLLIKAVNTIKIPNSASAKFLNWLNSVTTSAHESIPMSESDKCNQRLRMKMRHGNECR